MSEVTAKDLRTELLKHMSPTVESASDTYGYKLLAAFDAMAVEPWVEKAWSEAKQGCTVVCLLPPAIDSQWFRKVVVPHAEYYWYSGRIKFEHPENEKKSQPTKGNLLAIFRPPLPTCWNRP